MQSRIRNVRFRSRWSFVERDVSSPACRRRWLEFGLRAVLQRLAGLNVILVPGKDHQIASRGETDQQQDALDFGG
jgi:hypothetical protein